MKKDKFLLNLKNKQCFLEMLTTEMNTVGTCGIQSAGDAETLIATTAVDIANLKPTVLIGEDVGLLILVIHFVIKKRYRMMFFMSNKNIKGESKVWSIHFACQQLDQCVCDGILVIHDFLGCDTTSRVFFIGKGAALTKFQKGERFQQDILLFLEKDVSKAEIKEAGERLLVSLYGGKANNSLDQIRVYKFHQRIASNNKVVQPEYLCPTLDAAGFHSFRVYCQVQRWKERDNLNSKDWGWKEKSGKLVVLYTSKDAAPVSLLKLIRYGISV